MVLRPIHASDLDQLVALEAASFPPLIALDRQGFRYYLSKSTATTVVVEHCGEIVAYAILAFRPHLNLARFYSLAVSPRVRGQKIGEWLTRWAIETARPRASRLLLEVHAQNRVALSLYQKLGFHVLRKMSPYYDDGSDAYKLELSLEPTAPVQLPLEIAYSYVPSIDNTIQSPVHNF